MEHGATETLGQPVLHLGIGGSPASAGGYRALVFWCLGQRPRGFYYLYRFLSCVGLTAVPKISGTILNKSKE